MLFNFDALSSHCNRKKVVDYNSLISFITKLLDIVDLRITYFENNFI